MASRSGGNRFSREEKGSWRGPRSSQRMQRDMNDAAVKDAIRALDVQNALEFYGLQFNRQKFAICPFHNEKTASFRVKDTFWHCFGCGETGDLIAFVRRLHGLSYPDAIETICKDFSIVPAKMTIEDRERIDRIRLERYNITRRYEELLEHRGLCLDMYLLACDKLEYVKQYNGADLDSDAYVDAQYAVMTAQKALERAEQECADYLREHPNATLKKPRTSPEHAHAERERNAQLPPAPKWHGSETESQQNSVSGNDG